MTSTKSNMVKWNFSDEDEENWEKKGNVEKEKDAENV